LEGTPSPLLASPSSILTMYLSTCAIVSDLSVCLSLTDLQNKPLWSRSFFLSIYISSWLLCLSVCLALSHNLMKCFWPWSFRVLLKSERRK
jgi:hypothetical protein